MTNAQAAEQARLTLASLEGSIIVSRVYHTADPLWVLANHLRDSLSPSSASQTPKNESNP